jgi:uncharacterized protein YjbJ (UPF0337 family)
MNWDQVEGKWKQMKGSLREQWGKLTDDDFETIQGNRDRFLGKLQERYGYTKEQAEQELERWNTHDRTFKAG